MNNATQTALATAITAATEALEAAQQDRLTEARQLLTIVEEQLTLGEGGNAAAAARRKKILRLQAEAQALIDAALVQAELVETASIQPELTEEAQVNAPANLPATTPMADASPQQADKPPRQAAPPQHLSPEAWSRVQASLVALGIDAAERDAQATKQDQAAQLAAAQQDRYAVKVAQRLALIARVEAAALRGEVDAANDAWDKLFDIVTALRISELNARRKEAGETEQAEKLANYTAAREDSLRIRQWARTVAAI